jgi:hypothetical protein
MINHLLDQTLMPTLTLQRIMELLAGERLRVEVNIETQYIMMKGGICRTEAEEKQIRVSDHPSRQWFEFPIISHQRKMKHHPMSQTPINIMSNP